MVQFNNLLILNVCFCLITIPGIMVLCVPVEYDVGNESYDLDTEQSEARYDPRLLSEELRGTHSNTQQGAEACISSELRYEHGQKISRSDPCEVCLCVDGEVFCWWKQCESVKTAKSTTKGGNKITTKKPAEKQKQQLKYTQHKNYQTNFTKTTVDNFPKGILSFPLNLPVHLPSLDLNNETIKINHTEEKISNDVITSVLSSTTTVETAPSTVRVSSDYKLSQQNKHDEKNTKNTSNANLSGERFINGADNYSNDDTRNNKTFFMKNVKENENEIKENEIIRRPQHQYNEYQPNVMSKNQRDSSGGDNRLLDGNKVTTNILVDEITLTANTDNSEEDESSSPKHIKIDDITSGQHYVITASGNVENADVLASDSVLSQFKNNYPDVQALQEMSSYTNKITTAPPSAMVVPAVSYSQMEFFQSPKNTNDNNNHRNSNTSVVITSASISSTIVKNNSSPKTDEFSISENQHNNTTMIITTPVASGTETAASEITTITASATKTEIPSSPSSSSFLSSSSSSSITSTDSEQQNCIVMGVKYKIGTILPQETGNCLQCVCIEGSTTADPPRVTCNPHNCPPLILPDLFDTTGY